MIESDFRELVGHATEFLRSRIANAQAEFQIGEFERYDYDFPSGRFWWSDGGVPKVEARVIVVGSISTTSNTWLWAWANPHLDDVRSPEIERVREYGIEHRISPLVEPKWAADEIDGWEMTSISAQILDAHAAYRCPDPKGFLFLLLHDLKRVVNSNDWPFDQAPNVAAISDAAIVVSNAPILLVVHCSDDDSWAFLSGRKFTTKDGKIIARGEALRIDPSLREIADLPPGWTATREKVGGPWTRRPDSEV